MYASVYLFRQLFVVRQNLLIIGNVTWWHPPKRPTGMSLVSLLLRYSVFAVLVYSPGGRIPWTAGGAELSATWSWDLVKFQ